MKLIGLGYKAGVGKDTVARELARYGFIRYGFADALKEEVLERLPRTLRVVAAQNAYLFREDTTIEARVRALVYDIKPPVIRAVLQEYGTAVRRNDDPNYWVDRVGRALAGPNPLGPRVVLTDMRFINEAQFVKDMGGYVVMVCRPQAGQAGDHVSETQLDGWRGFDWILHNHGTIDELRAAVDHMVAAFGLGRD